MKLNNIKATPLLGGFTRVGRFPIDDTQVFDTKENLNKYLNDEFSTAFEGQVIAVTEDDTLYFVSKTRVLIEIAKLSDVIAIDNKITQLNKTIDELKKSVDDEIKSSMESQNAVISDIKVELADEKIARENADTEIKDLLQEYKDTADDGLNKIAVVSDAVSKEVADRKLEISRLETELAKKATTDQLLQITTDTATTKTKVDALDEKIDHLSSDISNDISTIKTSLEKTTSDLKAVQDKVSNILHQADEGFDTFEEVAAWIKENGAKLEELKSTIDSLDTYSKAQVDEKLALYAKTSDVDSKIDGAKESFTEKLENYAKTSEIPTKVSQLDNDAGYLKEHQQLKTINGESLVGTGDIQITGGSGGSNVTGNVALSGTEDNLLSIQIGEKKYKVPGASDLDAIKAILGTPSTEASDKTLYQRIEDIEATVGTKDDTSTTIVEDVQSLTGDLLPITSNLVTDGDNSLLIKGGTANS